MRVECYNPAFPRDLRFRMPSRSQRVLFLLSLAILVALVSATPAAAQEWAAPARELAEKIVARTQSRTALSLTVKNLSSLPQSRTALSLTVKNLSSLPQSRALHFRRARWKRSCAAGA